MAIFIELRQRHKATAGAEYRRFLLFFPSFLSFSFYCLWEKDWHLNKPQNAGGPIPPYNNNNNCCTLQTSLLSLLALSSRTALFLLKSSSSIFYDSKWFNLTIRLNQERFIVTRTRRFWHFKYGTDSTPSSHSLSFPLCRHIQKKGLQPPRSRRVQFFFFFSLPPCLRVNFWK